MAVLRRVPGVLRAIGVSVVLALAGCGGGGETDGGSSGGSSILFISPSLGQIKSATVKFYAQENYPEAAPLGQAVITDGGAGYFELVNGYSKPFILSICGGTGVTYFDESVSAYRPLASDQCLRAIIPNLNKLDITISAYTEAAVRILERQGILATATEAQIEAALETVRQKVNLTGSILVAPALPGTTTELGDLISGYLRKQSKPELGDAKALEYGYRLSALAKAAAKQAAANSVTVTAPAYEIADALASDLSDGVINGQGESGPLGSSVYDVEQLNAWMAIIAKEELESLLGEDFPDDIDLTTDEGIAWLQSHGKGLPATLNVVLP